MQDCKLSGYHIYSAISWPRYFVSRKHVPYSKTGWQNTKYCKHFWPSTAKCDLDFAGLGLVCNTSYFKLSRSVEMVWNRQQILYINYICLTWPSTAKCDLDLTGADLGHTRNMFTQYNKHLCEIISNQAKCDLDLAAPDLEHACNSVTKCGEYIHVHVKLFEKQPSGLELTRKRDGSTNICKIMYPSLFKRGETPVYSKGGKVSFWRSTDSKCHQVISRLGHFSLFNV